MTWLEWALGFLLLSLYITLPVHGVLDDLSKGAHRARHRRHLRPWLWLIGAILPAKPGSRTRSPSRPPVSGRSARPLRRLSRRASEVAPTAVRGGGDGVRMRTRLVANG